MGASETKTIAKRRCPSPLPLPGGARAISPLCIGAKKIAADACAADWNALHASVGSFADEHSTL